MKVKYIDQENADIKLRHEPSVDFNHQIMKRKHSSQLDLEKAKKEARDLLKEGNPKQIMKDKLMSEKQSVSLVRILSHFFEPIDWLFCILAFIGSIGSGISMPIMSYFIGDVYSDVGNTSENRYSADAQNEMEQIVKDTMNSQIKKQLITGAVSFVCSFFSVCFWALIGNRFCYNMKKNILQQYYLKSKVGSIQIMPLNLQQKFKHNLNK